MSKEEDNYFWIKIYVGCLLILSITIMLMFDLIYHILTKPIMLVFIWFPVYMIYRLSYCYVICISELRCSLK